MEPTVLELELFSEMTRPPHWREQPDSLAHPLTNRIAFDTSTLLVEIRVAVDAAARVPGPHASARGAVRTRVALSFDQSRDDVRVEPEFGISGSRGNHRRRRDLARGQRPELGDPFGRESFLQARCVDSARRG